MDVISWNPKTETARVVGNLTDAHMPTLPQAGGGVLGMSKKHD